MLTVSPTETSPRLVLSMVSSIISNCTLFESIETTVRQTPLIDTLAPMAKFSTLGKLIVIEVTVLTVF